jgi:proteasome assembly chaperone (PAC2) family protein
MVAEQLQLNQPRLVAVWPGMSNVALNAGIYLLSKMEMSLIAELDSGELFDVEAVEVKEGIVQATRRPRNRFFLWSDPHKKHDLIVVLGEAQPPIGKYQFCRQIISHSQQLGVQSVYTFAAMATRMHPEHRSRVFAAATDAESLDELKKLEIEVLEDGNIGGLNGVLLGAASEAGMRGACLLGEIPHIFSQLPFPKASLAILEVFTAAAGIELDFAELAEQANQMEQQLGELLARIEEQYGQQFTEEAETYRPEPMQRDEIDPADRRRIESLFEQAVKDRAKAFELKQELDRLKLFADYEDRFLDLFKKSE